MGGLILGTTEIRYLTLTEGQLWSRLTEHAIPAFDSSGADDFDTYYLDIYGANITPSLEINKCELNGEILDISWNLHQNISSSMDAKQYPLRENADYNIKKTGTSVYHESDMIAHGGY